TSSSPDADVENGAVVRVPMPSEKTTRSTMGPGGGGPLDTTRATALSGATGEPATGSWLITRPASTLVLNAVVTAPAFRPAAVTPGAVSTAPASACVWFVTSGTTIGGGPDDSTRSTGDPASA